MSSEPCFHFHFCFRHSISLPQHFRPLATPRTLSPDFRLPFCFRFRHSISFPQQFYPKHTLLHFRHHSRSRLATLLLPVTLQFTFLFQTFSNFHLRVTTVQNGLRGLGHKRGVLSCTVTSPDLSPEASGSLPCCQPHIPKFPTCSAPSDAFHGFLAPSNIFRNLLTLTYFLYKDKSKFRIIVTFFFILQEDCLTHSSDSLFRTLSRLLF